ncbi:hypothetical protein AWB71_02335 [Caballeronia peredens]|nr:hypothetical protein AWB71_02335 [Caballeronia peredens]
MKLTTIILSFILTLAASMASAQTNASGAAFGGDPGSLAIKTVAPAQGAPDSPVTVQIDYSGLSKSGIAVTYRSEAPLTLVGAATRRLTPDSSGAYRDTVVVRAASAGVYFLNVFAKTRGVTKVVSIPVTIGNAMLKPRGASSVATPNGERVIEMPAQQTVR